MNGVVSTIMSLVKWHEHTQPTDLKEARELILFVEVLWLCIIWLAQQVGFTLRKRVNKISEVLPKYNSRTTERICWQWEFLTDHDQRMCLLWLKQHSTGISEVQPQFFSANLSSKYNFNGRKMKIVVLTKITSGKYPKVSIR